jgi:SAM-dependent methyltransferase
MSLSRGSRILDVGAGKGHESAKMLKDGYDVYATDIIDRDLIDQIPKFRVVGADTELDFDAVVCFDVIEHIKRDKVADFIKQLYSYAPRAFLTISHREAHWPSPAGADHNLHETVEPLPVWLGWLRKAGYRIMQTEVILKDTTFVELKHEDSSV